MRPPAKQAIDKPTLFYGLALTLTGGAFSAWVIFRGAGDVANGLFILISLLYLATGLSALGMSLDSPPTGAARYALYFGVMLAPPFGAYCVSLTGFDLQQRLRCWLALGLIEIGILWPLLKPLWTGILKFLEHPTAAGPLPQMRHETVGSPPVIPEAPSKPGQEQLVAAGSFKIDRAKALEKLQKFQLEDPDSFLLPWIRCAVVSGARKIELVRIPGGIEMRFDGIPFSRKELAEPYGGLFSGDGKTGERSRHLAVGLLGALRTGPAQIAVYGGHGPVAARLLINDPDSPLADLGALPGRANVLRVRWSDWLDRGRAAACLDRAREGFGPCSADLIIEGRLIDALPKDNGNTILHFRQGKSKGCVLAPWLEGARAGKARLYKQGALAAEISMEFLSGEARFNDDELTLNISQSGVVKNARLDAALELIRDNDKRLPEPADAVSRAMSRNDWAGVAVLGAGLALLWLFSA